MYESLSVREEAVVPRHSESSFTALVLPDSARTGPRDGSLCLLAVPEYQQNLVLELTK